MSHFLWQDALAWKNKKQRFSRKRLRTYLEVFGVYGKDQRHDTIFTLIYIRWMNYDRIIMDKHIIDVIFEFKPDLRVLCCNYIDDYSPIQTCNYYVLEKFLEQDTGYVYIRYPFRYCAVETYPNFICFILDYNKNISTFNRFINIFKNHCWKGITFFELMYYRLEKNICLIK